MSGAATAVPGSVEAGAERELQPGDKDTDTNTETKKTTNAQSQPLTKLKQSVKAIYSVLQKEELQTGHKYCAVARSCYPTNQLI